MKKVFSSEDVIASNLFASLLKEKGYETKVQELRGVYFPSKYDVFAESIVSEEDLEQVRRQIQSKSLSLAAEPDTTAPLKKNTVFKWVLWFILIYAFSSIIYSFLKNF
jgi:hypothetical protein